jgi:hypothetical protein
MKNLKTVLAATLVILALSACEKATPPIGNPIEMPIGKVDFAKSCAENQGNWLADYKECENIGEGWCDSVKGTYKQCETACRHNPDAKLCTKQCVPVCETSATEAKSDQPALVGGDRDAHGCIGSAGYSWCEAKSKCLRIWEEPCGGTKPSVDLGKLCVDAKGEWSGEWKECGGVDKTWCEANGGRFEECGSACRHDPKAEMCTLQCVIFCDLS